LAAVQLRLFTEYDTIRAAPSTESVEN
jgi:hypothetical protein